jgi:hypothetical protein
MPSIVYAVMVWYAHDHQHLHSKSRNQRPYAWREYRSLIVPFKDAPTYGRCLRGLNPDQSPASTLS